MDKKSHAGHEGHSHGRAPADVHSHDHVHDHDHEDGPEHGHGLAAPVAGTSDLKDPVCGMTVTDQSAHHAEHEGLPYFFCSAKCLAKFSAEPSRYVQTAPLSPEAAEAPAGSIYTCPMHPEIRQDHPAAAPSAA